MYLERVHTRRNIKAIKKRKTGNLIKLLAILFSSLLFVFSVSLLIYCIQPLVIRNVEYVSSDPNFQIDAKDVMEEFIGKEGEDYLLCNNSLAGIVRLRLTEIERVLAGRLPQYKNFVVTENLFGVVTVAAEPRTDFMYFCYDDIFIVSDSDGYAVKFLEKELLPDESLVVSGMNIDTCNLGDRIEYSLEVKWKTIAEIYFTIEANQSLSENVDKIVFAGGYETYLSSKNNVVVRLGSIEDQEEMFDKLKRLTAIFRSDLEFSNGTIFLADNGVDTFRPDREGEDIIQIETEH